MDVLEPIEPEGIPGPTTPPSLGHPLGDPYAQPATGALSEPMPAAAPHRRRLGRVLVATAVVAGIAGAAIGVGVAGSHGRSTLTFQPAATTGGSGSSGSSSSSKAAKAHNGREFRFGRLVAGTVSKVNGNTITVTTAKAGTTDTITTNGQTKYGKIVLGKVTDIKTQQTVAVVGKAGTTANTLTASYVAIIPAGLLKPPAGAPAPPANAPAHPMPKPPAGAPSLPPRLRNIVIGQVSSVNGTSFVVTRRDGTKVTVTTTSTTKVIEQATATAADVVVNTHIVALGTPGTTANTLTASRIEIIPASLASMAPTGFGFAFGPLGLPFGGFGGPGFGGFGGPGGGPFGGPGMRFGGHGFGGGWGMKGSNGQPGAGSGSGSSSGSSSAGSVTPQ
jgi:hypothetical protein